ncbi:MAG: hypothetical protein M3O92_09280 [Actinomycetota bacterium]|nr:hypothetical protein [Actinomycetota bacterium]
MRSFAFTAAVVALITAAVFAFAAKAGPPWGPETPHFNLEVVLRGDGFGLVKFRQPNDADKIVYLDTWVRDLAPNKSYRLERATDTTVDDNCTGTAWLTLGKGTVAQAITTDDKGTGRAQLFRNLSTLALGATFDIQFRVIDATTSAVVLKSSCYQYTVSQ